MTGLKATKRALISSVIALFLCFSMLLGTTFAWFTDSVTSSGNIIQSGTLKIGMHWAEGDEDPASVTYQDASVGAIFNNKKWEPGYAEAKHVKITNDGTLALRYKLLIVANGTVSELANVIDVYYLDTAAKVDRATLNAATPICTLADLIADPDGAAYGVLLPAGATATAGEDVGSKTVTIALKMRESAGNEYQGLSIGTDFSVQLLATQLSYESDSFDNGYDTEATFPMSASGNTAVSRDDLGNHTVSKYEIPMYNTADNGATPQKVGSVLIDYNSVADDAEELSATYHLTDDKNNITVDAGFTKTTYEIKVNGLKTNNSEYVTVKINVGKGLQILDVYHEETKMSKSDYTYSQYDGILTIESKSFSPFTLVYDAEIKVEDVVVPEISVGTNLPEGMPIAEVTSTSTEYAGKPLEWESFGPVSQADANQQLSSTYLFTAPEKSDENYDFETYKDWICDYVVSINRDIDTGVIFLGGNYGTYGWVGFYNPEAVTANTEIPLLGSVAQIGLTYEGVVDFVGNFLCGVAPAIDNEYSTDNAEKLSGAIFTVKLRMTNPQDESEYYDVNIVNYTFPTVTND